MRNTLNLVSLYKDRSKVELIAAAAELMAQSEDPYVAGVAAGFVGYASPLHP